MKAIHCRSITGNTGSILCKLNGCMFYMCCVTLCKSDIENKMFCMKIIFVLLPIEHVLQQQSAHMIIISVLNLIFQNLIDPYSLIQGWNF